MREFHILTVTICSSFGVTEVAAFLVLMPATVLMIVFLHYFRALAHIFFFFIVRGGAYETGRAFDRDERW